MCIAAAQSTGATVLAVDMPGTGEIANLPLGAEADQVVLGVAQAAKAVGNGRVGHIAISFGANFSAMTGLTGAVDAAVDNGGPVKDAFAREHITRLPYGMFDIVGNAPMLVVDGADDHFVPASDTLVFQGRPNTEVHLIPGTGHVAMSKMAEVMPMMLGWLRTQLQRPGSAT
jgi:esterase FrsA